ncbi:MAG TPA: carboxypeptidase-like regulatory domain-containing protein [Thermoanaerobaculia bacterium]
MAGKEFAILWALLLALAIPVRGLAADSPKDPVPMGFISGKVTTTTRQALKDLAVETPARSRGSWSEGEAFACTLTEHRFQCPIPAGKRDARLVSRGFAPSYLWNLEVESRGKVDVGALLFHPGSSLAGWIQVADRSFSLNEVSIELQPEVVGWQGNPAERKRTELRQQSVMAGRNGFFQLAGLSPGQYVLTAKGKGFSPAATQVSIPEGREVVLSEPLFLEPLSKLQVSLDPPARLDGGPWQVEVLRFVPRTNVYETVMRSAAALDGNWLSKPLQAGTYEVVVRDAAGSALYQTVHRLDSSTPPLFIDLDLVPFRGTLTMGGKPIAAALVFGTTNRQPNVRVEADADGRFSGSLPREGLWPVEVLLSGDRKQRAADVEVERLPSGKPDVIEVELPETRLSGQVIARGAPVSEAFVVMMGKEADGRPRREAALRVDREGRFEALGLSPGHVSVRAYDRTRTSKWVDVHLDEDTTAPELRLELGESVAVKGLLTSSYGPAPGGLVVAWAELRDAAPIWLGEVVSGADGSFELSVDARAEALKIVAAVPGCGVEIGRFAVPREPGALLNVACGPARGEILLQGFGPEGFFLHDGAEIPANTLFGILERAGFLGWSEQGSLLRAMPVGPYRLCISSYCKDDELVAGGRLSFTPPVAQNDREETKDQ